MRTHAMLSFFAEEIVFFTFHAEVVGEPNAEWDERCGTLGFAV